MEHLPLKDRLVRYLRHKEGWVANGHLQRLTAEKTKHTPAYADRLLRQLREDGVLEVKYIKNHAHYRYKKHCCELCEMTGLSV